MTQELEKEAQGIVDLEHQNLAAAQLSTKLPPPEIVLTDGGGSGEDHNFQGPGDAKAPQTVVAGSGMILRNPRIQLVFWGAEWSSTSQGTATAIIAAAQRLCTSAYFSALRQYGYDSASYEGAFYVATSPPASFKKSDVDTLVFNLIGNGQLPHPNTGNYWDLIYCVLMPSTATYGPGGLAGAHFDDSWTDPATNITYRPYVAWIGNGTLDAMSVTLSHELVEAISDPQGNGIQVAPANPTNWHEIGDVCASVAYMDGIAVQSYWSQTAGSCVIPTSQFDSLEQRPPAGVALQAIAISLNYSRELHEYWIGYVRTTDPATGQVYDLNRGQAVDLIDQGANSMYVIGNDGSRASVQVARTPDGHGFLRTQPDDTVADNLLSLPHFS